MKKLTKKQIKNLEYVLEELPKLAEEKPHIKNGFDMGDYGVYNHCSDESECSTNGCLLGNIALLEKFKFEDYVSPFFKIDRNIYKGRFSYHIFTVKEFFDEASASWEYLFSENWYDTKFDDFDSAMERVSNILKHGRMVEVFSYKTNKIIK